MRLTEKLENGHYRVSQKFYETSFIASDKLGQLEDIEDDLGIELITLFKALKYGVWFRDKFETNIHQYYPSKVYLHCDKNTYWLREGEEKPCPHHIRTCDYGKAWALTKEELV